WKAGGDDEQGAAPGPARWLHCAVRRGVMDVPRRLRSWEPPMRFIPALLAFALFGPVATSAAEPAARKPNVFVILADDKYCVFAETTANWLEIPVTCSNFAPSQT